MKLFNILINIFLFLLIVGTIPVFSTPPEYYVPTNYLPTNGRYSNTGLWQLYASGIVIRDVVLRYVPLYDPPPPLGEYQSHTFECWMDCYISLNGGMTYSFRSALAWPYVRYNHTASSGFTETFETEVTGFDVSIPTDGGPVMLRESPTLASTGTQHTTTKGGRYSIDSFFDIFTEVSVDGGQNWYPASGLGTLTFSYPPECRFDYPMYPPPLPLDAKYTDNEAVTIHYTSLVWIRSFNFNKYSASFPLPPRPGRQYCEFDDEVRFEMTVDGGATWNPITTSSHKLVVVDSRQNIPPARFFDTEMRDMNISGLPGGMMMRESPGKESLGKLNVETLASPFNYTFSSFFDIFTEISLDGGMTWIPADRTIPVYLVRNPEVDVFTHTIAQMTILYPNQMTETINLTGPTTVNVFIPPDGSANDNDGDGRDEVNADIESMSLSGTSMGGPVTVTLDPRSRTLGQIEENVNNTLDKLDIPPFTVVGNASSFFDIYVEVEIPGMKLYGATAVRMQVTITHKPPAVGETYQTSSPVTLVDSLGNPTGFTLLSARHTPNPVKEVDVFPNTKASVQIIYPDQTSEVVQLRGPTTVDVYVGTLGEATDTDGDGLDQVSTEIVSMNLTGTSTVMGPVTLRLRDVAKHPFQRTIGQIEENANATVGILDLPPFTSSGTASSFFDVFFEIEAGGMILHNGTPKHMHTTITHKPPAQGETYDDPFIVALVDENNLPTGVSIAQASHTPSPFGVISGYKWRDNDNNGIWDRGEPPVSGWTIRIGGAASRSTVTNDTGWYEFTNLPSGPYGIQEDLQEHWSITYPLEMAHMIILLDGQEVRGLREQTVVPNFGNYKIPHDCPPWTQRFDKKVEGMGFKIPTDAKLMTRNLAIRDTGDIYICGYSNGYGTKYDYITNKYDEYGTLLWSKRYNNGPVNKDDKAYALTIDAEGNVYVTGESVGDGTKSDILTIKYNAAGDSQWIAREHGDGGPWRDAGYAISLNDAGTIVYVTGEVYFGKATKSDYITIAYDAATGAPVWTQTYNGPGSKIDKAYAIAVDASGDVIVTGESDGGGTKADYTTIKYAGLTGAPMWASTVRYDGPPSKKDYAFAIKTDAQGNVYVTGASEGDGTSYDYATVKYSSAGAQLWVARYDEASKKDFGYDLALDGNGDVYVTGASTTKDTKLDYATLKYDGLTGAPMWASENRYDGIRKNDIARSVVICDAEKAVFVTGSSDQGAGRKLDYVTLKIDAVAGGTIWTGRYNGPGVKNDIAYNVAVRPEDCCVVLTGTSDGGKITKMDFATIQGPSGAPVPGPITTPGIYDGESEDEDGEELPMVYNLKQNYPNPFNPITTIAFELPEEAIVSLSVYNILGQELVKVLDNELMDSGLQEAEFDASSFASGVYFYRLNAVGTGSDEEIPSQSFTKVMKMLLLK